MITSKNKRFSNVQAGFLSAAMGLPAVALGVTLQVDNTDPNCDDGTGTPYCTVQAAIDASSPGGIVKVGDGVYGPFELNVDNLTVTDASDPIVDWVRAQ